MRKFVRHSKSDPLVEKVELVHVNPSYAFVKYRDGRDSSVSLRDLAPCPEVSDSETVYPDTPSVSLVQEPLDSASMEPSVEPVEVPGDHGETPGECVSQARQDTVTPDTPSLTLRRSSRITQPPSWLEDYERR